MIAGLALAMPLTASASFVVGWHSFTANNMAQNPIVNTADVSAQVTKAGFGSTAVGGSTSGVYGTGTGIGVSPGTTPDGYLQIRGTAANANIFTLTSTSPGLQYLKQVFFDAASIATNVVGLSISYVLNGNTVLTDNVGSIPKLSTSGWTAYGKDLSITLNPGDVLQIKFTNLASNTTANRLGLDNIAFVVVPEPANVLGLGALLGSTLVMRHRRRKVTA